MKYLAPVFGIAIAAAVVFVLQKGEAATGHPEFDRAMEQARLEEKCLFLAFTGSDWCDWCVKFENEIISRPAFQQFSVSNLVVMIVDFPRGEGAKPQDKRTQDMKLASRFGVQSYPSIFILCPEGNAMAETGYRDGGSEAYVAHIRQLIAKGMPE